MTLRRFSLADYMFETTTPAKGEKLSDEKVNGSVALLLFDMVVTVS